MSGVPHHPTAPGGSGLLGFACCDLWLVHDGGRPETGTSELYDVIEDPQEKHDLAAEKFTLTAQMVELLANQFRLDNIPSK